MAKFDIDIYTDGGAAPKNPGIGGWGAILRCEKIAHETELCGGYEHTTNNRMELMAVIEALQTLKSDNVASVTIYADSQYVVNAFNQKWMVSWKKSNWKNGTLLNLDLWKQLAVLVDKYNPKFVWVKAHNGHVYNERVDALCAVGRKSQLLRDDVYMKTVEVKDAEPKQTELSL